MRRLVFIAGLVAAGAAYSYFQDRPIYFFSGLSSTKPIASHQFTVPDGDTIRIRGEAKGTRLVGFNAPETYNARCAIESALGKRATK